MSALGAKHPEHLGSVGGREVVTRRRVSKPGDGQGVGVCGWVRREEEEEETKEKSGRVAEEENAATAGEANVGVSVSTRCQPVLKVFVDFQDKFANVTITKLFTTLPFCSC